MADATTTPAAVPAATPAATSTDGPIDASQTPANAKDVKVTLYWLNQSRSQRILWLLEELHLPYEVKLFQRGSDGLAPKELKDVHPLGKSPVISIAKADGTPILLPESAFITEYLVDHFGAHLKPPQWRPGCEGQVAGETPEWMRYRYYMHYAEGSLMTPLIMLLVASRLKSAPVPFFLKFLMNKISDTMGEKMEPFARIHIDFLEQELAKSPGGGPYLCGTKLTAADILMSFPLQASRQRLGVTPTRYPNITRYVELLEKEEGYKRGVKKIEALDGKKYELVGL